MSFYRLARKIVFGLIAVAAISYGWTLYAYQQQGKLTPPPKPAESKIQSTASSSPVTGAAVSANESSGYDGTTLRVGERLTYNVTFSEFAVAGRIEMEVVEQGTFFGQDGYQIRTKAESVGQVRSLFGEIDHQYTAYVNPRTATPYRLVRSIRQGKTRIEDTIVFDQGKQQAIFSDDSSVGISPGTFDLTSLIYAMRLQG
ncbi:MAG: DUF3108 domain-containing protein, partial [Acidobacteriota bacterium]